MKDDEILAYIEELVNEEHKLREDEAAGNLEDHQRERMQALDVKLDQCWDLLRQRRARRSAGMNPDEAQPRDASIVEHFKQ